MTARATASTTTPTTTSTTAPATAATTSTRTPAARPATVRRARVLAIVPACLLLAGCPQEGADGADGAGGKLTPAGTVMGSVQTGTGSRAEVVYRGTLSFGGTIALSFPAADRGKVTISFPHSPYGLSGRLIGDVTTRASDGRQVVTNLRADSADPPPDLLAESLRDIALSFATANGLLTGDIEGVPNVSLTRAESPGNRPARVRRQRGDAADIARLAGLIHASATTALPALASIAGTYAYLAQHQRMEDLWPDPDMGMQRAESGQLRIGADGSLATCPSQPFQPDCKSLRAGEAVHAMTLRAADQTRFPGMFDVLDTSASPTPTPVGQLFMREVEGKPVLLLNLHAEADDRLRIGTWVARTAEPLPDRLLDGSWTCRQPDRDGLPRDASVGDGGLALPQWRVAEGWIEMAPNQPMEAARLTLNAAFGVGGDGRPAPLAGVAHAQWADTPAPVGTQGSRQQVMLPLDGKQFVYLAEDDAGDDEVVWGSCDKVAEGIRQPTEGKDGHKSHGAVAAVPVSGDTGVSTR
ncbi:MULTISPECIES: hypothetical protein [unclassified Cupriavidus]|uniref:hypothetical protein n=1 Tax=Cupriavidus sp. H19C3 TaxID=3241603 RepID=UPI003BF7F54F